MRTAKDILNSLRKASICGEDDCKDVDQALRDLASLMPSVEELEKIMKENRNTWVKLGCDYTPFYSLAKSVHDEIHRIITKGIIKVNGQKL